jgi:hypothetical protein
MSALSSLQNGDIRKAIGNNCASKITLAINAGAAATVKSTGAINFNIDGVCYTHAALAAQAITVTHDCFGQPVGGNNLPKYVQPVLKTAYYLICLNAAGTVAVCQGSYLGQALAYPDLQRVLTGTGGIPQEPDGYTAIGMLKVALANAATFNPGTTALDAADVTVTYFDLERVPSVAP